MQLSDSPSLLWSTQKKVGASNGEDVAAGDTKAPRFAPRLAATWPRTRSRTRGSGPRARGARGPPSCPCAGRRFCLRRQRPVRQSGKTTSTQRAKMRHTQACINNPSQDPTEKMRTTESCIKTESTKKARTRKRWVQLPNGSL